MGARCFCDGRRYSSSKSSRTLCTIKWHVALITRSQRSAGCQRDLRLDGNRSQVYAVVVLASSREETDTMNGLELQKLRKKWIKETESDLSRSYVGSSVHEKYVTSSTGERTGRAIRSSK